MIGSVIVFVRKDLQNCQNCIWIFLLAVSPVVYGEELQELHYQAIVVLDWQTTSTAHYHHTILHGHARPSIPRPQPSSVSSSRRPVPRAC